MTKLRESLLWRLGFLIPLVMVIILSRTLVAVDSAGLEPGAQGSLELAGKRLFSRDVRAAETEFHKALEHTKHKVDVYLLAVALTSSASTRSGTAADLSSASFARELLELSDANKLDRKLDQEELKGLLRTYGSTCYKLGQREEAFQALERAAKTWPDDPGISNDLGYTYAEAGVNLERALELTKEAVRRQPDEPMCIDSLGWVYYKLGRNQDALRELKRAVKLMTGDPTLRLHLGAVYVGLGKRIEAEIEFDKARALDHGPVGREASDWLRKLHSTKR